MKKIKVLLFFDPIDLRKLYKMTISFIDGHMLITIASLFLSFEGYIPIT